MKGFPPTNRSTYSLAWPIALNAAFQEAILVIDTVLVGGLGEDALAAMGIAISISGIVMGVVFALANGAQILIAQAFGASSDPAIKSGFWSGIFIGIFAATVGVGGIVLFHTPILSSLASTPLIAQMATEYLLVFTLVLLGVAYCQNVSVYFYATGRPRLPFFSKLIELPVNALVSWLLIYGVGGFPEMGIQGAAVGSAVAVLLRAVFLSAVLFYQSHAFLLRAAWSGGSPLASVRLHLAHAIPIAGTFISMNMSFSVCLMLYSQLPVSEFAALSIVLVWMRTIGQLYNAWSQAIGILVGQILGRDERQWLDVFVKRAWRIAIYIGIFISLVNATMPLWFELFYPSLQKETVNVVWSLVPVLILLPLARTSNTVCGNVLRAGGQAAFAFKVHVCAQWLFTVPITALIILVLDGSAVWVLALILGEELLKGYPFHKRTLSGVWKSKLVAA